MRTQRCKKIRQQPLDLTVFGSLKKSYASQCDLFLRNNNYEKITPYDVASIFKSAFVEIATTEMAQKGFQTSGLVSLNSNIFTDEDYLPATVMDPNNVEIT